MGIGVCLAQFTDSEENTLVDTLYVGRLKPSVYFQIVTYGGTSGYIQLAAHRDIATYRNVTVYMCCLD